MIPVLLIKYKLLGKKNCKIQDKITISIQKFAILIFKTVERKFLYFATDHFLISKTTRFMNTKRFPNKTKSPGMQKTFINFLIVLFCFIKRWYCIDVELHSCILVNASRNLNRVEDRRILACATVCWVVTLHAPAMPVPSSFRPWNIRPGRPCLSFCSDSVLRRQHRRTECSIDCQFVNNACWNISCEQFEQFLIKNFDSQTRWSYVGRSYRKLPFTIESKVSKISVPVIRGSEKSDLCVNKPRCKEIFTFSNIV